MIFMLSSTVLITAGDKISDYSWFLLTWRDHVSSKVSTTVTLLDI